jgi:translation initiation factor RLI1
MTLFIDTFPVLVAFENLDMLENLQTAKKALYGLSGIYGVVHKESNRNLVYWFFYGFGWTNNGPYS